MIHLTFKDYFTSVREEQLQARVSPSQAEPFVASDLLAVAELRGRLHEPGLTPSRLCLVFSFLPGTKQVTLIGFKPERFYISLGWPNPIRHNID